MVVERGPFLIMIRPKTRHEMMLEFGWKIDPRGGEYIIDVDSFIQKSEAQKWGEYVQQKNNYREMGSPRNTQDFSQGRHLSIGRRL